MVKNYSKTKDGETYLQKSFKVREFASPDSDKILIDTDLIEHLQKLRDCLGLSALRIVSGYRTAARNKSIGGSSNSRHMLGLAADVQPFKKKNQFDIRLLCCAAEVLGLDGIGPMQTAVHLDTRGYQSWFDENKGNQRISTFKYYSWFSYYKIDNLRFMDNPFPRPINTPQRGDKSDGVRWLQFELIKTGSLPLLHNGRINIDGDYGARTDAAVLAAKKE